jgi:hypothetical protein
LNPTYPPLHAWVPKDVIETMKSPTTITTAALAGTIGTSAAAVAAVAPAALPAGLNPTLGGRTVGAHMRHAAHETLVLRDARLAKSVRHLGSHAPSRRALERMGTVALRKLQVRLVRERRDLRRAAAAPAASATLQAIAACESGGNPSAIGGGGAFRGKYQFTRETWAAMGGSGDPAVAPEYVQDRLAAKLYATSGAGQWPVCGR